MTLVVVVVVVVHGGGGDDGGICGGGGGGHRRLHHGQSDLLSVCGLVLNPYCGVLDVEDPAIVAGDAIIKS